MHIVVIIVVAQHRENAVGGMQPRQDITIGFCLGGRAAHEVTREANHVGVKAVDGLYPALHDGRAAVIGSQVGIAPLHDAIAVKLGRQAVKSQFHLPHFNCARRDHSAPPHHTKHQRRHDKGTHCEPPLAQQPTEAMHHHAQRFGGQNRKEGVEHILPHDKSAISGGSTRQRHQPHAEDQSCRH